MLSGESPLLIFVSSVMTGEMSSARKEIRDYVNSIWGFDPWLFEDTPASSEDVVKGYLRKVRESDIVIWLVGDTTTSPVENEIREALSLNTRLLAFKLPVDSQRDERTESLIQEVGKRAKWSEISEDNTLLDALGASLRDEIIRGVRKEPGLSRIARFNELLNSSKARCIARWQAAGVSLKKAVALYDDKSIGRPPMKLDSSLQEKKIVVLTGDYGSGKSLMSERVLQKSITKSVNDSSAPIPVFIKAQNVFEDLSKEVIKASDGLGDPRIQGAFIIIDGADEAGISASFKILNEARVLVRSWSNTYVIITSRPLPAYSEIEENVKIDPLEVKDIISLVFKVSGVKINSSLIVGVPKPIREAISRPFFAILWANYLLHNQGRRINSTGELINYFIEDTIHFTYEKISKAFDLLEVLGSKSIDYGGIYVPWREIGTIKEINLLLETSLIEKVDGKIGFPLPILTQWFAANSLINGKIDTDGICRDLSRLDKWLYPLIVVVSLFSHADVSRILTPVVMANPGIAAEIIHEGLAHFDLENKILLPSTRECGKRIRQVYSAFISGIGDLAKHIAPLSEDSSLLPTGINTSNNKIMVAWYNGKEKTGKLTELPYGFLKSPDFKPGWHKIRLGEVISQPAWAWKWVLEDLSTELNNFISRKAYVINDGHMYREKIWEYALEVMRFGDLHDEPIILDQLEPRVLKLLESVGHNQHTQWHELNFFIRKLRESGETILKAPWPSSDIELIRGGWIWEPYSDKQILNRAIAVYTAALEEYENLINMLFGNLKSRMLLGTLLPVKIQGQLLFPENPTYGRNPQLNWYFEPLPKGSENFVDIRLSDKLEKLIDQRDLLLIYQKMRPGAKEWIFPFTSFMNMNIFNTSPVTDTVYEWLEEDLRRINWLN